jgi:hypothetical protein|uniref:Uncharacterized protein n=1 Tax=viral metagenome TaxID=1070528 RepID=A0A6C0IT81_9ZZZZ
MTILYQTHIYGYNYHTIYKKMSRNNIQLLLRNEDQTKKQFQTQFMRSKHVV